MARMPGAIWKPISKSRGTRRKGRGICLHVAVSEASSLFGYFSGATSDSHFYVRKDGTIEQYVDTDLQAYANGAGNASLISVETQGGLTNADREPWTPQQIDALGRLVRWSADTDGFPIQQMPDSRPASRGVGYHRLGCKPWVVSGGELWSSSVGKICPGAGKIAQIPQVIAAARGGSVTPTPPQQEDDDMPLTDADIDAIAERVWRRPLPENQGIPILTLLNVARATTEPIPSKLNASVKLSPRDMLREVDGNAWTVAQQVAALTGSLNAIADALRKGATGDGFTVEEAVAAGRAGAEAALGELGDKLRIT